MRRVRRRDDLLSPAQMAAALAFQNPGAAPKVAAAPQRGDDLFF
jgi:hypothetical protein